MAEHISSQSFLVQGRLPESFLSPAMFNSLWALRPEEAHKIAIYGKEVAVPRRQQSFLQDYTFSGATAKGTSEVPETLQQMQTHLSQKTAFNQILVNWYENGHDYIGSHADDEPQLATGAPIASVSLGATRTFRIRDKHRKIIKDIDLRHGDVLWMCGEFQKEFKHEIVKVAGAKGLRVKKRINVTFRVFQ